MILRIQHIILLCFLLFFLGFLILPLNHEWAQSFYGQNIYPIISAVNQFLWSKVPFSIGDFGYVIGVLLTLIKIKRFKLNHHIGHLLSTIFIIITAIVVVVVVFVTMQLFHNEVSCLFTGHFSER